MNFEINNQTLTMYLQGRIDATNAPELEAQMQDILKQNPCEELIIDADELAYISSAGLRVMLRMRKEYENLKIINVVPEVYEVFEMTGFVEMITIEKAYRKLSVEGCESIGRGANGEVFRYDPETIVKVYFKTDCLPDIQRERTLARYAFVSGIPTAIPYDVVKVGDKYGSVFELLNADSLAKLIVKDSNNIDKYVKDFADLLKLIHSTEVDSEDIPDIKGVVVNWVEFLKEYLPSEAYEKLNSLVQAVPQETHMLHGDYHTGNVMIQNGEVLLIDMDTLSKGNPIFELASVYNAYVGFSVLDHSIIEKFQGFNFETGLYIWRKTLQLYFETEDEQKLNEIEDKAALIGYVRLMRRSIRRNGLEDPVESKAIAYYKEQILERLNRIDSLTI